jgi:hypothetical protein
MSALVDEDEIAGWATTCVGRPERARGRVGEPRRGRREHGHGGPVPTPGRRLRRAPGTVALAWPAVTGLGVFADGVSRGVPGPRRVCWSVRGGPLGSRPAVRTGPDSDRASVMVRIRQLNGLGEAMPVPGRSLTVPVAAAEVAAWP